MAAVCEMRGEFFVRLGDFSTVVVRAHGGNNLMFSILYLAGLRAFSVKEAAFGCCVGFFGMLHLYCVSCS